MSTDHVSGRLAAATAPHARGPRVSTGPQHTPSPTPTPTPVAAEPAGPLYVVEGLASHAANLLTMGVFFYAHDRFGWGAGRNLLLATAMGVVYTVCALLAQRATARLGLRTTLMLALCGMAASASVAAVGSDSQAVFTVGVLAHMAFSAFVWPSLESLVCVGLTHAGMARRLAVYNLVWPGVSALTVAVTGLIVHRWPVGMFVLPAIVDVAAVAVLFATRNYRSPADAQTLDRESTAADAHPPHADAALLRVRTRALWLSRIALPATFVVVNGMMAVMPSLPLMQRLGPETQTLAGGVWLVARWLGFLACGWTVWWHTRPRAMLVAAVVMLVAFLGVTLPWPFPQSVEPTLAVWLAWTIGWQLALGFCLALIYSASLYFGMVLSDASAEHSGYHEALIGLGTVLGPGAGAAAQLVGGSDPIWGTLAVASVMGVSVIAAAVVAFRPAGAKNRADGST